MFSLHSVRVHIWIVIYMSGYIYGVCYMIGGGLWHVVSGERRGGG